MTRVAGTREARLAWIALRGPYLLAYLALFALAIMTPAVTSDLYVWRVLTCVAALLLVSGSLSSFMVVNNLRPRRMWRCGEALETTGLRAIVLVQVGYFVFASFALGAVTGYSLAHFILGALAAGALQQMTWRKTAGRP